MSKPVVLSRSRTLLPALVCALLVIVCTLAAWPFAETGLDDDYSYIFSAKALAETGHVHYVGWASAMVGWQLALGAAFLRVFGFSFTAARMSMLLIAALTAFLLQRLLVRCGLSARNAVLVTLAVLLSPMALPLAFSFMTDMSGLFCTVVTTSCCVRALQTARSRSRTVWLLAAMLLCAVGGTARQTAWLCLVTMVPSTAWLLRRRGVSVLALIPAWVVSLAFAYGSMKWFYRQPYSVQEVAMQGYIDRDLLAQTAGSIVRAVMQCCLLAVPVLVAFVPRFPFGSRKAVRYSAAALVTLLLLAAVGMHSDVLRSWLLPFPMSGNFFSAAGVVDLPEIGVRPAGVPVWAQALTTIVTVAATVACIAFAFTRRAHAEGQRKDVSRHTRNSEDGRVGVAGPALSEHDLLWLIAPFSLLTLALILHRALFAFPYDRYFLPLLPLWMLGLVRMYQRRVAPELPRLCFAAAAVLAVWGVATLHDTYADRRATLAAAQKLIDSGVPRTAFYAGFEYDGWTQIEQMGWMNVVTMRWPDGFHKERPIPRSMPVKPCHQQFAHLDPAIQPRYGISFDQKACDGASEFAPVTYHTWLPPFTRSLYIRKVTTPAF